MLHFISPSFTQCCTKGEADRFRLDGAAGIRKLLRQSNSPALRSMTCYARSRAPKQSTRRALFACLAVRATSSSMICFNRRIPRFGSSLESCVGKARCCSAEPRHEGSTSAVLFRSWPDSELRQKMHTKLSCSAMLMLGLQCRSCTCQDKPEKKNNHYILPANSGLIRCLVPHGRAS